MFFVFNQKSEPKFWEFFAENDTAIFAIISGKEPIAEELTSRLKEIDGYLVWSIGGSVADAKRDFVISAGGIKNSFPVVTNLYNSAPKNLDHWNFIAFSPKTDTNEIQFGGKSRKVDDIYFTIEKPDDKYDIAVYINNYDKGTDDQIVYLFLDSLLGEYNVEIKLGGIDISDLGGKDTNTLLPLKQLGNYVK